MRSLRCKFPRCVNRHCHHLRILPIRPGLPYSEYVDEGHVLHQTIDAFNHKSLDVYWYGLPALTAYSAGAAIWLCDPVYRHFYDHSFQEIFRMIAVFRARNSIMT